MYPTISHLLNDLFGIDIPLPIQTFGFWVAIAFLAAFYVITKELKGNFPHFGFSVRWPKGKIPESDFYQGSTKGDFQDFVFT